MSWEPLSTLDPVEPLSRRSALSRLLGLAAAGDAGVRPRTSGPMAEVTAVAPHLPRNGRILFQGDSITDGGRGRTADPNHLLGHGYAFIIAALCGGRHPDRGWTFLNRGVSGDRVPDLAARWEADTIALRPDLLSVLVGINDAAWLLDGRPGAPSVAEYEQGYDRLLQRTAQAVAGVRFVLCEPFVLPVGRVKERWAEYDADVKRRQEVVARLARKHRAPVVRLQRVFDRARERAPAEYWIWDGIHPTYAGHQLVADEWLRTVNDFY